MSCFCGDLGILLLPSSFARGNSVLVGAVKVRGVGGFASGLEEMLGLPAMANCNIVVGGVHSDWCQ